MLLLSLVNCTILSRDELLLANRTTEGGRLAQQTFLDVVLVGPLVTDEPLLAVPAGKRVNLVHIVHVNLQQSFLLEFGTTACAFLGIKSNCLLGIIFYLSLCCSCGNWMDFFLRLLWAGTLWRFWFCY